MRSGLNFLITGTTASNAGAEQNHSRQLWDLFGIRRIFDSQ